MREERRSFTLIYGKNNEQSNEAEISLTVWTTATGQSAHESLETGKGK